jgi:hypothetical protein
MAARVTIRAYKGKYLAFNIATKEGLNLSFINNFTYA